MILYITRRIHFSAAHRLFNPTFTFEKNEEIFDKCNTVHGHNYTVDVTVKGTPDPETGYVLDLKILKRILEEHIVDHVDHKHLNEVALLDGLIPTAENIAVVFWNIIEKHLPVGELYSVKVFESDNNWAEYLGEQA